MDNSILAVRDINHKYIVVGKKYTGNGKMIEVIINSFKEEQFPLPNGSGVPNIFNVWLDEGWEEPVIEERFDPDRTVLSLCFNKKVAKKSGEKKVTKKTQEKYDAILNFMQTGTWYKASEFETIVGVKESRIKVLLKDMTERGLMESAGSTKGKKYKKLNKA